VCPVVGTRGGRTHLSSTTHLIEQARPVRPLLDAHARMRDASMRAAASWLGRRCIWRSACMRQQELHGPQSPPRPILQKFLPLSTSCAAPTRPRTIPKNGSRSESTSLQKPPRDASIGVYVRLYWIQPYACMGPYLRTCTTCVHAGSVLRVERTV
jgi:hypothetical protein